MRDPIRSIIVQKDLYSQEMPLEECEQKMGAFVYRFRRPTNVTPFESFVRFFSDIFGGVTKAKDALCDKENLLPSLVNVNGRQIKIARDSSSNSIYGSINDDKQPTKSSRIAITFLGPSEEHLGASKNGSQTNALGNGAIAAPPPPPAAPALGALTTKIGSASSQKNGGVRKTSDTESGKKQQVNSDSGLSINTDVLKNSLAALRKTGQNKPPVVPTEGSSSPTTKPSPPPTFFNNKNSTVPKAADSKLPDLSKQPTPSAQRGSRPPEKSPVFENGNASVPSNGIQPKINDAGAEEKQLVGSGSGSGSQKNAGLPAASEKNGQPPLRKATSASASASEVPAAPAKSSGSSPPSRPPLTLPPKDNPPPLPPRFPSPATAPALPKQAHDVPPPPPPPPPSGGQTVPKNGSSKASIPSEVNEGSASQSGSQSLLDEIRKGSNLKKIEQPNSPPSKPSNNLATEIATEIAAVMKLRRRDINGKDVEGDDDEWK